MSDFDIQRLANANDILKRLRERRKRLLDIAPTLFDMLSEFFNQDGGDKFIVDMYWEILKTINLNCNKWAGKVREYRRDEEQVE